MANTNSTAALLMRCYGDVANPVAGEHTLAKDLKFDTAQKLGELFYFPVRLGLELGATFNNDHSAFPLNGNVDGTYQSAQIDSSEIAMQATLSYGEMAKLNSSKGRGKSAYDQGVGLKIANLMDGGELIRDAQILYGSGTSGLANLGVVNAIAVASSAGVVTVNITRASWMSGFWQDAFGLLVDVYTSGGALRNASAAALKVTAVDPTRCRVTLTSVTATNTDTNAIAATDQIFFYKARNSSMVGIQAIAENVGTLFNISAATFPQWRAVQYAVGGALNLDKVAEGLTIAAENGLTEGCNLYVNARTWTDLMTDEVALRRYVGENGRKATPGFSEIEFTFNCGVVTVKPYRYMKQSLAFALPKGKVRRGGSTDLTFTLPGNPNEFFFRELNAQAGSEIRLYTDQFVICDSPFQLVEFTGISNTADAQPA